MGDGVVSGVGLIGYVRDVVDTNEQRAEAVPGGLIWRSGRMENHLTLSEPRLSGLGEPLEVWVLGQVTPLVRSVGDPDTARQLANYLNSRSALSAVIWDGDAKTLALACSLTMHQGNLPSVMTWDSAFYLQAYQAERFVEEVAAAVGGVAAFSAESEWVSEPDHIFKNIGEFDLFNLFPFDDLIQSDFEEPARFVSSQGIPTEGSETGMAIRLPLSAIPGFDFPTLQRRMGSPDSAVFQVVFDLESLPPDVALPWKGPFSYLDAATVQWTGAGLAVEITLPQIAGASVEIAEALNAVDLAGHLERTGDVSLTQLGGWFFDGRLLRHRMLMPSTMLQEAPAEEVTIHVINALFGENARLGVVWSTLEEML